MAEHEEEEEKGEEEDDEEDGEDDAIDASVSATVRGKTRKNRCLWTGPQAFHSPPTPIPYGMGLDATVARVETLF